jgi:probable rRNA maturation factor
MGSSGPFGGIVVDCRLWRVFVENPERVVARALAVAGCRADVVLTDDRTIKRLNGAHRGIFAPTNVLTFEAPAEILLGFETVRREAAAERKTVADHLAHLTVHGALHLQGFDHHHAGQARVMEMRETRLLARMGVGNPWTSRGAKVVDAGQRLHDGGAAL